MFVSFAGPRRALLDPPGPPPGMQGSVFPPHEGMGPPRGGPPGGFGGPPPHDDFRRGPPPGDGGHPSMGPPSGHFGGPPPMRGGYGSSSGELYKYGHVVMRKG